MTRNLKIIATLCLLTAHTLTASADAVTEDNAVLNKIADRLDTYTCIKGQVEYEVSLPNTPNPVTYTIKLTSVPADGDTLAPCGYLIDWTLPRPKGESRGFAAYGTGNYYQYHDLKLQEYHYAEDSTPFNLGRGVQNQAQFGDLLPAYMAQTMRQMATDSSYVATVRTSPSGITVRGKYIIKGYDAFDFEYVFNPKTMLPVSTDFVYNPASITEQTLTAHFTWQKTADCPPVNEKMLTALYPEVFEKFRTSNFRVESLVGAELPEFSSQTLSGGRYTHHHGESMHAPTVIVFLDPAVETTRATVRDIRKASTEAPKDFDIIYVFTDTDNDTISEVIAPTLQAWEVVLTGARSLVRDTGVNAYPTLLFVNSDGIVKHILTAYDTDLPTSVVMQMTICD